LIPSRGGQGFVERQRERRALIERHECEHRSACSRRGKLSGLPLAEYEEIFYRRDVLRLGGVDRDEPPVQVSDGPLCIMQVP
jgi:hypothetical protein